MLRGSRPACLSQSSQLGGRIDPVVVLAVGEHRQLVQVFGKPAGLLGQMKKAVLDHRGLGVHAHDLVRLRLVAGDGVQAQFDQLLDQLGARRLSSINRTLALKASACRHTARFNSGYSMRLRNTCSR
jgi:hypothetical protein